MNDYRYRATMSWTLGTLLLATSACAFAGGSGDDDSGEDNLRYFGFVKDAAGRTVPAAQVSVAVKGSVTLTASTDATGAYRIPVPKLLPNVSPQNITVTCSKAGYKQLRAVVRSNLAQKPLVAVEVECTLQAAAAR